MRTGYKHLVECNCSLPQFSKLDSPPFHQFIVFSEIEFENDSEDDEGTVIEKFAQCNNCGVIHKVTGICQSEILKKDELRTLLSIEDIKLQLPEKIVTVLEREQADISTYEMVQFVIENELWGTFVSLNTETIDDEKQIKGIRILGINLFKIEIKQQRMDI